MGRETLVLRSTDLSSSRANSASASGSSVAGRVAWFPLDDESADPDEWVPCKLASWPDGGPATLRRGRSGGATVQVIPEKTHLIFPRQDHLLHGSAPTNLVRIEPRKGLGSARVEEELRNHFCSNLHYTSINDVTVLVNPFRELSIYELTWVEKYASLSSSLPPHIYEVAARAYKHRTDSNRPQSIVLLGESCSGKSRSLQHLIDFWTQSAGNDEIEERLNSSLQAVRPLVSVWSRTECIEWSSTRAVISCGLFFDSSGFLALAKMTVRALEMDRLVARHEVVSEVANFEALYLVLKDESAREWIGDREHFSLLGTHGDLQDIDATGHRLRSWKRALSAFGIKFESVVRLLCGLLLLSEVDFVDTDVGVVQCSTPEIMELASEALGVESRRLTRLLCDASTPPSRESAVVEVGSVVADMYRRFVDEVLGAANAKLESFSGYEPTETTPCITITDVPSFFGGADAWESPDALGLQWLVESALADLLDSALYTPRGRPPVESASLCNKAASEMVEALEATSGLLNRLRRSGADLQSSIIQWAESYGSVVKMLESDLAVRFELTGTSTKGAHTVGPGLCLWARGRSWNTKVLTMVASSPCSLCSKLANARAPEEIGPGADAVRNAIAFIQEQLSPRASSLPEAPRPWLVCCLRPNERGTPTSVCRSVVSRQVRSLFLADMIQLSASRSLCNTWDLGTFAQSFAPLLSRGDIHAEAKLAHASHEEICQSVVDRFGSSASGVNTVGAENVYGTASLKSKLETELREFMAEHRLRLAEAERQRKANAQSDSKKSTPSRREQMAARAEAVVSVLNAAMKAHRSVFSEVIRNAESAFTAFDQDGSGALDAREFKKALKRMGVPLSERQAAEVIEIFDKDGDGMIALDEFTAALEAQNLKQVHEEETHHDPEVDGQGDEKDPQAASLVSPAARTRGPVTLEALRNQVVEKERGLTEERSRQEELRNLLGAEHARLREISAATAAASSTSRPAVATAALQSVVHPLADNGKARPAWIAMLPSNVGELQRMAELNPTRSMTQCSHAEMHTSLLQMAANLRVAKECDRRLQQESDANVSEAASLDLELTKWRAEADRNWRETQELERKLGPE
eukprot:TRINITY_DN62800_c0_g1_i1.p1 TRINITY_DN62800_c0_g1~~TRINITY_DN62800_c0_g1_i1.p1  ORF type:complete len:1100 (+),score=186.86 TRINITY_DN62800_c0_g1_i1:87-3386(+)